MRQKMPLIGLSALFFLAPYGLSQEAYRLTELKAERYLVAQGSYFPRIVALRSGDLLATFKYGAAHVGKSGKAGLARSQDGGRTWSTPETIFDIPDADDGVDASGELPDGSVALAAVSYTWEGKTYNRAGWTGSRQSREPSLTVGLLNSRVDQISSPRVSKGSTSTQGLTRL
ncbi:MAG: exo-alpha-sialidase [Acidimicrobiia bacterium]|nr:exo-alpha-sialidase [Acidimicrobiia bacterium]